MYGFFLFLTHNELNLSNSLLVCLFISVNSLFNFHYDTNRGKFASVASLPPLQLWPSQRIDEN